MSIRNGAPTLSGIVPVGNLNNDYNNLYKWISKVDFARIEIIIVIDNNMKADENKVKQLKKDFNHSKLIIVNGFDAGPGSARNIGVEVASAPWIVFWDSDDLPYHMNLLEVLENSGVEGFDAIVGGYEILNTTTGISKVNQLISDSDSEKFISLAINPGIWRICFRATSIEHLRFPEIFMGEDQVFIASFFTQNRKIKFTKTIFYRYQIGNHLQLTNSKQKKRDILIAIEEISAILKKSVNQKFTRVQLVRLFITGVLRGDWVTRIFIIRALFLKTIIWQVISPKEFLITYKYIWKNHNVA